jgi:hypothetical protein
MAVALSSEQQAQIDRILADPLFNQSQRCASFLRFVAEHGQAALKEPLTERAIGIKVFHRAPDYDTEADPIVRVTASEVRKRLGHYYENAAHAGEMRVVVHRGSYLAEFYSPETQLAQQLIVTSSLPAIVQPEPAVAPVAENVRRIRPWLLLAACCCLVAVTGTWFLRQRPTAFERFWSPLLSNHPNVVISYEQPVSNWRIVNGAEPVFGWTDKLTPTPINPMPWSSFLRTYVDRGQIPTISRISEFLGGKGKHVSVKEAADLTIRDMRDVPAVILGGFNNRWTERLLPQARFHFEGEGTLRFIADRQQPANRQWSFDTRVARDKDLIIVSRVSDRETGRITLLVGGFSFWGTEAAVEFVANRGHLEAALAQLPQGWEGKNVQLVLWCTVIQGTSDMPKFLAAHTW